MLESETLGGFRLKTEVGMVVWGSNWLDLSSVSHFHGRCFVNVSVNVFKESLRSNMLCSLIWKDIKLGKRDKINCTQKSPPCFSCLQSLHSFLHHFHHDYVTPFLQVTSPGLEKQSIQSRRGEEGRGKKREIWVEISPEVVGCLQEKRRRSNLEGRRIFPSQVIHLCLQNSFRDQSYCAFVVL